MLKPVIKVENNRLTAIDEYGEEMPEYLAILSNVKDRIAAGIPEETVIAYCFRYAIGRDKVWPEC
jgi:hypothetical protein